MVTKLSRSTWGTNATLSILYPAAEYLAPAWFTSAHTELNRSMSMISGTIQSITAHGLPTLYNIAPLQFCRQTALIKQRRKYSNNPELPFHDDIGHSQRFMPRKLFWKSAEDLHIENYDVTDATCGTKTGSKITPTPNYFVVLIWPTVVLSKK